MPFFCPQCGTPNPDESISCQSCGYALHAATAPPQVLPPGAPGRMRPQRTNGFAIASLVCGILFCFCPTAVLAVLFGHIARRKLREDPTQQGAGLATAGLVLGYIGLVFAVLSVLIALPDFLRNR